MAKKLDDKAPAYQWYPKDWRSDEAVKLMTWEQRGIYRDLLDHQWLEGSIPGDVAQLAVLLHVPLVRFRRMWPLIASKFTPIDGGRLLNLRLERQRGEQEEFIQTKKAAGSKGGQERARRLAEAKQRASRAVALLDSASSKPEAEPKPASASASATQEPPIPPAPRGAARADLKPVTRSERTEALAALRDWRQGNAWSEHKLDCPHQDDEQGVPACETEEICIGIIVQRWRLQRADGQLRAIDERQDTRAAS